MVQHEGMEPEPELELCSYPPESHLLPYSFVLTHLCSNNAAECPALLLGLQMALQIGVKDMDVYGDSRLVISHVLGEYEVKKEDLMQSHKKTIKMLNLFDSVHIGHVLRDANKLADALANLAANLALGKEESMSIHVCNRWVVPPLDEGEEDVNSSNVICVHEAKKEYWRQPIISYLDHQKLSADPSTKQKYAVERQDLFTLKERFINAPSLSIGSDASVKKNRQK